LLAASGQTKKIVTDEKNKPGLDEQTFGMLLEAAYVLQEHNREMRQMEASLELHSEQLRQQEAETQAALLRSTKRAEESSRPNPDYVLTLAEIVEAQHQIQIRHLESGDAMAVVAERITRITHASGAAIGILEGKTIHYRAGAGEPALPVGSEVPLETAICTICIRTGQVLRTPDVNTEFLFDPELCRAREIESLVAVPIYHDGNIVGALELYFGRQNGFAEQDIHTCQLMAGLVTEAIGRGAGSALKKSMAEERSSMLAAIEKLKPDLTALAGNQSEHQSSRIADNPIVTSVRAGDSSACWKCGSKVIDQEQFCGKCGAPRVGEGDPSSTQSKLASALQMQAGHVSSPSNGSTPPLLPQRNEMARAAAHSGSEDQDRSASLASFSRIKDSGSQDKEKENKFLSSALDTTSEVEPASQELVPRGSQPAKNNFGAVPATLMASQEADVTWRSAAKARDFLETLAETRSPGALARFWRSRRGDVYLAVAIILVLIVVRWGILSNHSVGATGSGAAASGNSIRRKSADSDLSTFDKLLISLGLAEAPEAPEYKGNPDTQVWIDLHTALYYCPDSDLYGKTPKGRFASQHDAQLDQFEPASRKACD
jgi:putative methionine-R-sulfoxide reductase with GAF domain